MQESKIVATKRLQDEGRWNEAFLYREGIRGNNCATVNPALVQANHGLLSWV